MTTSPSSTASSQRINVLVLRGELTTVSAAVDETERTEDLLRAESRITPIVATTGFGQAVSTAQGVHPDIILVDDVFSDPADLCAELDEAMADTPIVVVLDESQGDRAQACVLAGARVCVTRPVDAGTLCATIIKVHDRAARRRKNHADRPTNADALGRLIAVRGAKGGVGTSVVATNLAIAIRQQTKQPTALVDGHFFGGDVPVALNLKPSRSLLDLARHVNGLDGDMLHATLVEHSSGVAVLAAPPDFEDAEAIRADEYQRVLDALRAHYTYVIVDCSPAVDQHTLTALDMADLLLIVSTPEIAALKSTARLLELGARLGYSDDKMRLVLSRFDAPGALAPADFEPYLAHTASFRIPNDGSVIRALTRGEPSVMQRGSKAGKALGQLASTVVANAGWANEPKRKAAQRPGRFGFRRQASSRVEPVQMPVGAEAA